MNYSGELFDAGDTSSRSDDDLLISLVPSQYEARTSVDRSTTEPFSPLNHHESGRHGQTFCLSVANNLPAATSVLTVAACVATPGGS